MGGRKRADSTAAKRGRPTTRPKRGRGASTKSQNAGLFDTLAEVAGEFLICKDEIEERNESATADGAKKMHSIDDVLAKVDAAQSSRKRKSSNPNKRNKQPEESGEGSLRVCVKSFSIPEVSVDISDSATLGSVRKVLTDALMNNVLKVSVVHQGRKINNAVSLSQMGNSLSELEFTLEPTSSSSSCPDDTLFVVAPARQQRQEGVAVQQQQVNVAKPPESQPVKQEPDLVSTFMHAPYAVGNMYAQGAWGYFHPTQQSFIQQQNMFYAQWGRGVYPPAHQPYVYQQNPLYSHGLYYPPMYTQGGAGLYQQPSLHRRKSSRKQVVKKEPDSTEELDAETMLGKPNEKQPRVRHPFTVAEVEALVGSYERLGPGRWSDIKLMAFHDSDHRTYVDLKDKWKTLVRTAGLAPHKRRGVDIPQELLDRVTAANTYWTNYWNAYIKMEDA